MDSSDRPTDETGNEPAPLLLIAVWLVPASLSKERPAMTSTAYVQLGKCFGAAVLWTLFAGSNALAQGLPVENGPHWPIGLIFAGAAVLGLVLAYGIMRNRSRTRSEKKLTEDVTASRYRTNTTTEK